MKVLKIELSQTKKKIVQIKAENERLKQVMNLNIFANDDLDQYKLLNYVKTKSSDKFVMCHTYNEKITMKECGKEEGNWIIVSSSPKDLFKLNIDIDLKFIIIYKSR